MWAENNMSDKKKFDIYEQSYIDDTPTRKIHRIRTIELSKNEDISIVEKRLSMQQGVPIYLKPYTYEPDQIENLDIEKE